MTHPPMPAPVEYEIVEGPLAGTRLAAPPDPADYPADPKAVLARTGKWIGHGASVAYREIILNREAYERLWREGRLDDWRRLGR